MTVVAHGANGKLEGPASSPESVLNVFSAGKYEFDYAISAICGSGTARIGEARVAQVTIDSEVLVHAVHVAYALDKILDDESSGNYNVANRTLQMYGYKDSTLDEIRERNGSVIKKKGDPWRGEGIK